MLLAGAWHSPFRSCRQRCPRIPHLPYWLAFWLEGRLASGVSISGPEIAMLIEDIHPNTLAGVKRLAKQYKKTKGIRHSDALELAAKSANFESFRHAQRSLPMTRTALSKPYILLTIYWSDKELRHRCGRETLRIEMSMPILDLCEKSALRYVRGFGNLRMVAGDHFVCDDIAPNQEYARSRLCTVSGVLTRPSVLLCDLRFRSLLI